jgi:preprotein translocase subunit SecA
MERLELSRNFSSDSKSDTSTNYVTSAILKIIIIFFLLTIFDFYWTEHLERMSSIRETINWRSYGQQNPLTEYNLEAFQSFQEMIEEMRSCMIYYFLDHPILQ